MSNIIVTGWGGTGSTAFVELLEEYKTCSTCGIGLTGYEHYLLSLPDSFFDLKNKLLYNNGTPDSATDAIYKFKSEMEYLYKLKGNWFGDYQNIIGPEFITQTEKFLEKLGVTEFGSVYYNEYKGSRFSFFQLVKQLVVFMYRFKFYGKIGMIQEVERTKKLLYAYPDEKQINLAIAEFVEWYFSAIKKDFIGHLIVDHLINPPHISGVIWDGRLLFNDTKILVIKRDPRDIFVLGKYYWNKDNYVFCEDPNDFVRWWGQYCCSNKEIENKDVLYVWFEDLIYNYDRTTDEIEQFLGLSRLEHVDIGKYVKIERSIDNTQVFLHYPDELKMLNQLKDYFYPFPYERIPNIKEVEKEQ